MRKLIALAAILTATIPNVMAAVDGVMPAALPGPFHFIMIPQQNYAQPTPNVAVQNMPQTQLPAQPYWMRAPSQQLVPYWMQGSQRQQQPSNAVPYGSQGNATMNTQTGGQLQGGFSLNAQARSTNTANQGYGQSAAPGNFPGYGARTQAVQNTTPRSNTGFQQPQSPPNYQNGQTVPYPQQQSWNGPWNGNWGVPWGPVGPTGYGAPNGWGR